MTTDWLSGGLIIALAAVLWLAYLLPSWFRSKQYQATERNAVRLQQTLRILAETAEVPHEVRVEANARSIAEQERILKHRAVVREIDNVPAAVRMADRIRRSRAVTAGVLALSVVVAVLGGMQAAYTGAWIILVGGVLASVASVMVLVRLARAGRNLRLPRPVGLQSPELVDHAEPVEFTVSPADAPDAAAEASAVTGRVEVLTLQAGSTGGAEAWVPTAVPRPLYLSRSATSPLGMDDVVDDVDVVDDDDAEVIQIAPAAAKESLLRAAADAELALRERLRVEHETVAELPPAPARPEPAAPPSRFARMGIVEGDTSPHLDLDAVLARRRAV